MINRKLLVLVTLLSLSNGVLIRPVMAEGDEVIEEKPVEGLEVVPGYLNKEGLFVAVAPPVTTDSEGKYTVEIGEEYDGENIFLAARKPGDDSSTQMFTYADPAQPEATVDSKTTGAFNALTAAGSDSFTASEADPKQISAVFEAVDKIASQTPVATDMASYVGRIADAVALGGTDFAEEALKDIPMDGADKVQYTATLDQAIEPTDYNPLVSAREPLSTREIPAGSTFFSMMPKEFFDKYASGADPLTMCEQCTPPGSLGPTDGKKSPPGTFEVPALTLNPEALKGLKSNPDKPFMIGPGTTVASELPQLAFQAAPGSFFKVAPPGTMRLAPGAIVDPSLGIDVSGLRDKVFVPPATYAAPPGSIVSPDGTVAFNAMFRPPFQLSAEDATKMMQLPPPAGATAMYNSLDKQMSPSSFALPPMTSGFTFGSNAIGAVDPKNFPGQSFATNLEHKGLGDTAPFKNFDEFNAAGFVPPNPFGSTFEVGATGPFIPGGKPLEGVDPSTFFNMQPPPQGGATGGNPPPTDGGANKPSTGGGNPPPSTDGGANKPSTGGGNPPPPPSGGSSGGANPPPQPPPLGNNVGTNTPSADKPADAPPPPPNNGGGQGGGGNPPPPPPSGGGEAPPPPPPPQRIKARSIKAKLASYESSSNKAGVRSTLAITTNSKAKRLTASKGVYLIGKAKVANTKALVPIIIDPSITSDSVKVSLGLTNNEVDTQVIDLENDAVQLITQLDGKVIEMTTANSGVEDIAASSVTGYLLAPGTSAYKMQTAIALKGTVVAGDSGDIVQFTLPAKTPASGVYTIVFQDVEAPEQPVYYGKLTIGTLKARTISGKALAPNGQL